MSHHEHHHHEDRNETGSTVPFEKKMAKLLQHWINHNADHAETYRKWAGESKENNMEKISDYLNEAAEKTMEINTKLKEALTLIPK
jgi:hypothetical protein